MSGICAIVDFSGRPVDGGDLRSMSEAAAYRGPDGTQAWVAGNVGLAHLALHATPEAVSEQQPLASPDGELHISADARIDNRDELLRDLHGNPLLRGDSPGDATLILAAYERWGETCASHLIGDFAFVIWDQRKQTLFAARDALGVKPLHYALVGDTVCFASEAQQILAKPGISHRLDEEALVRYLVFSCSDLSATMFKAIKWLPPAHRLVAGPAGVRVERYWNIDTQDSIRYADSRDYGAHFREILTRAVSDRLRVPVAGRIGAAMSGGLDSTSVAALAHRELTAGGNRDGLIALSLAFSSVRECDERFYSQSMHDELGIDVQYLDVNQSGYFGAGGFPVPDLERPGMYLWRVSEQFLDRLREQGGRVILTGHGGDSMVSGTPLVYLEKLLQGHLSALGAALLDAREESQSMARMLYRTFIQPMLPVGLDEGLRRLGRVKPLTALPDWIRPEFAARHNLEARPGTTAGVGFRGPARRTIARRATVLSGVRDAVYAFDRFSAKKGIDARHPFLDRRIAEFVTSVPPELLYWRGARKRVLRQALGANLPARISARRDKTLSAAYLAQVLRGVAATRVSELFRDPILGKLGVVDAPRLRELWTRFCATGSDRDVLQFWFPLSAELWLQEYFGTAVTVD